MNSYLLDRFKANTAAVSLYRQGLELVKQSGILEILRDEGHVKPVPAKLRNYDALQTAAGNISLGYESALDDLVYFDSLYLQIKDTEVLSEPDYGALKTMLDSGDITQDEYDAMKEGKDPTPPVLKPKTKH